MPNKTLEDRYIEETAKLKNFYGSVNVIVSELKKEVSDGQLIATFEEEIKDCKKQYSINNLYEICKAENKSVTDFLNGCEKIYEKIATILSNFENTLKSKNISTERGFETKLKTLAKCLSNQQTGDTLGYE